MKEYFDGLPTAEVERISRLEYFDEYEEWNMKCYHYLLVVARSADSKFTEYESRVKQIVSYDPGTCNIIIATIIV